MELAAFLKSIISEFVEDSQNLTVESKTVDESTVLTVNPSNKQDVAKIIGKHGRTISSLRIIMRAIFNAKNDDGSEPKKLRITVVDR